MLIAIVHFIVICGAGSRADTPAINISVDRENVSHIEIYSRGSSLRTLSYSEHQDALDALFDMLSGDYECVGRQFFPPADGGGPDTLWLYDHNGETMDIIQFMDGQVYVDAGSGLYYTFEHEGGTLDFAGFYAYMDRL